MGTAEKIPSGKAVVAKLEIPTGEPRSTLRWANFSSLGALTRHKGHHGTQRMGQYSTYACCSGLGLGLGLGLVPVKFDRRCRR